MTPEEKQELLEIVSLFDIAESKIKEIERLCGELSIPSLNQLRYVGYHLTKAIAHDNEPHIFSEEIKCSKNHAKRAIYDTYEAGILYLLVEIKDFQLSSSNSSQLINALPNYMELCAKAQEASNFLQKVRLEERDREKYYDQCEPHIEALKNIHYQFKTSAPIIRNLEVEAIEKSKKETRRFLTTISLSLLGISILVFLKLYFPQQ